MNNPFKITVEQGNNQFYTVYEMEVKYLGDDHGFYITIEVPVDSTDTDVNICASIGGGTSGVGDWDTKDCIESLNELIKEAQDSVNYYRLWKDFLQFYNIEMSAESEGYGEDFYWNINFPEQEWPKLVQIAQENL